MERYDGGHLCHVCNCAKVLLGGDEEVESGKVSCVSLASTKYFAIHMQGAKYTENLYVPWVLNTLKQVDYLWRELLPAPTPRQTAGTSRALLYFCTGWQIQWDP